MTASFDEILDNDEIVPITQAASYPRPTPPQLNLRLHPEPPEAA